MYYSNNKTKDWRKAHLYPDIEPRDFGGFNAKSPVSCLRDAFNFAFVRPLHTTDLTQILLKGRIRVVFFQDLWSVKCLFWVDLGRVKPVPFLMFDMIFFSNYITSTYLWYFDSRLLLKESVILDSKLSYVLGINSFVSAIPNFKY